MDQVADGIYRLGAELVYWYAIDDGDRITLVDAGNPNQYHQLPALLAELGRDLDDVAAVVLTHAHGDHLGSSARIEGACGADILVHADDAALARADAERQFERHWVRDLGHRFAWKSLLFFVRGGALKALPIADPSTFADGDKLDLPGHPRVVHTPGHTDGSSCFVLDDRGVVFTGDALVTLSIVTGETGPRIMPGSFNKDSALSLASLERLRVLDADVVLPGHGEPWRGSLGEAVDRALGTGPS